jgi:hypothetical protein
LFKFIFYNRLFLGSCNSEQAAKAMMQPSDGNLPIVSLRFNSNRIDCNASTKPKKEDPCSVRVVIYNSLLYKFFYFSSVNLIV